MEEQEIFINGENYRLLEPSATPGNGLPANDPECKEALWEAYEILKENGAPEDTWRTLTCDEWQELEDNYFQEIFEAITEKQGDS